jgi:GNAT superfamily N-acetyltransferase
MVLTHSDGALGALHTEPEHRRKGLAKWVVQEHLALGRRLLVSPSSPSAGRAGGELAWTVVFKGNAASEGLWFRLGWKVGWECAWVYRAM